MKDMPAVCWCESLHIYPGTRGFAKQAPSVSK
jgi:hypothetical protein